MTGMRRFLDGAAIALVSILIGIGLGEIHQTSLKGPTTVTRLSPDETTRASVVEGPPLFALDRNFTIRLEDLADRKSSRIFRSPDEGGPPGTERLIWSKDGAWLLLVGRHFYVKEDQFLDNGDQLYFLHHRPSGRSWCNGKDAEGYPPVKADQVRAIEFTEPIRMRGE